MNLLPALNHINGRDKSARFIQYLCRALWYANEKEDIASAEKYKVLENHFSTFRKILRFGRCLESFYNASQSIDQKDKWIAGLAKIANGCFLFCDHIILLIRLKLINLNSNEWILSASRYWFLMDILNLVHNYYELNRFHKSQSKNKTNSLSNKVSSRNIKLVILLYLDIVKNFCDIFLPLCAMRKVNLNPGIIGILGMISSLGGLIALICPSLLGVLKITVGLLDWENTIIQEDINVYGHESKF